jgi:hypothetical protein
MISPPSLFVTAAVVPFPQHGSSTTAPACTTRDRAHVGTARPCCGKGTTAAVTKRLGGVFRGAELNPKRLAATQDVLKR